MLADSLDRLIAAHIAPDDIPGMVLRICHNGETLYDRGFGFRDFEQKKPMGADTICRIYSMTKPVTAVAAHILIEKRDAGIPCALKGISAGIFSYDGADPRRRRSGPAGY